MKVLHLDSGREMRGGQWQVLRLHQALIEAGHESHLLARANGPLLAMALQRGLPCDKLTPLFHSRNFDLVHAHDGRSHTLAALFATPPLVVSRRVAFPVHSSRISRWKYGKATRYLAVSRYVAGILNAAGVAPDRIDVVYDGVEIPPAPAFSTTCEGAHVISPLTGDPAKGMALAKQAAALAAVPLICSGNLERDLTSARALVYLTHSEGLGSAILLAMARGVTVIASNIGGIPELIEDGVTGLLVPNDAQAAARALRTLALQPERCARIASAARERAASRFTVSHMLNATLQSYEKALHV